MPELCPSPSSDDRNNERSLMLQLDEVFQDNLDARLAPHGYTVITYASCGDRLKIPKQSAADPDETPAPGYCQLHND